MVGEAVEHGEQLLDVVEVEARGGLIEDVEGVAGIALRQFPGELDTLSLAAGEGGGRLPEADVGQAHIHQCLQFVGDAGNGGEELVGVLHGHFQHLMDVLALVADFEGLPVVALALADVAGHIDIRQKVHLHLGDSIPLTGFAAPALDVEGETPGLVAPGAGFLGAGEQLADGGEDPGVGRGVGAGRAADGALVDIHAFVEVLQPVDGAVGCRLQGGGLVEGGGGQRKQGFVDQGGFPRAGHAGDAGEHPDGDVEIHIAQVVAAGATDGQAFFRIARAALGGDGDSLFARQVLAGDGAGGLDDIRHRALGDDLAAVDAGPGADIHHVVGGADGVLVVFHHDHRVAEVAQPGEGAQ